MLSSYFILYSTLTTIHTHTAPLIPNGIHETVWSNDRRKTKGIQMNAMSHSSVCSHSFVFAVIIIHRSCQFYQIITILLCDPITVKHAVNGFFN